MIDNDPGGRDARTAFLILQFMRLSGVAFMVFGIAVASGKVHLPLVFGYGLIGLGAVESLVLPALLARKWRSRP